MEKNIESKSFRETQKEQLGEHFHNRRDLVQKNILLRKQSEESDDKYKSKFAAGYI